MSAQSPSAEVLLRVKLAEGLDSTDLAFLNELTQNASLDEAVTRALKAGIKVLKQATGRKRKGAAK